MPRKKIKLNTNQRPFIMVYHDFLESEILDNPYQITLYICLKKFADENNQCFPSLKRLAKLTKMSISKVKTTLNELEKKGVIVKENRMKTNGGTTSNLYTLNDYPEIWNAKITGSVNEKIDIDKLRLFELAKKKGYILIKEKGLDSEPTKAQNQVQQSNKSSQPDNTIDFQESQDLEKYTLNQIKEIFGYDTMLYDNPYEKQHIDSVMDILHTTLNTSKKTIRIAGTNKPTMVVIGKLMKLNNESIMYAIKKFKEQTERIKNPTSYMLTILYMAPEQFQLDITNQVQHDFF
ncbi:DUF6017 domain-containing protein [Lachnospiraceae bacterium 48-33]